MNKTEITTDGICVFVHTKIDSGKGVKIFVRIALISILTGILLLYFTQTNSPLSMFGLILLLGGIIAILPMCRTILWNLYGEEIISFSTKSIVRELSYGMFRLPPKTYTYDQRLKFNIKILRDEDGIKQGLLHFYSYDQNNQPFHLFQTVAYMTEQNCLEIVTKIQLIFALDKDLFTEYSAN